MSDKVKPIYATGRTSEDTCVDCDIDLTPLNHCARCHHSNSKSLDEVHQSGKCEQCNCGESEIGHLTGNSNRYVHNADSWYRGDGHYIRSSRLSYLRNGRPRKVINYK
jgi:hypothetical protein